MRTCLALNRLASSSWDAREANPKSCIFTLSDDESSALMLLSTMLGALTDLCSTCLS